MIEMKDNLIAQLSSQVKKASTRHPKCLGYSFDMGCGEEFDCGYGSDLICEDCKYGAGNRDPKAKCNQLK